MFVFSADVVSILQSSMYDVITSYKHTYHYQCVYNAGMKFICDSYSEKKVLTDNSLIGGLLFLYKQSKERC